MGRAEAGTTKAVANKMKSKGLQRLRWYCQACEKQCRDENGFKCHTMSESHVRQMQLIGEDPRKHINEFSKQFLDEFLLQLRTGHGTKSVQMNNFYQSIIADKTHIHMNATKWKSLTEFAKFLSQEGHCRVEQTDKGIFLSWIDNSPEALQRAEKLRKQERMEKSEEQRREQILQNQIRRAHDAAKAREKEAPTPAYEQPEDLERLDGQKISFSIGKRKREDEQGGQPASKLPTPPKTSDEEKSSDEPETRSEEEEEQGTLTGDVDAGKGDEPKKSFGFSFGKKPVPDKNRNVFAETKKKKKHKNPSEADSKSSIKPKGGSKHEEPRKMTESQRLMQEDMERAAQGKSVFGMGNMKRQRIS